MLHKMIFILSLLISEEEPVIDPLSIDIKYNSFEELTKSFADH